MVRSVPRFSTAVVFTCLTLVGLVYTSYQLHFFIRVLPNFGFRNRKSTLTIAGVCFAIFWILTRIIAVWLYYSVGYFGGGNADNEKDNDVKQLSGFILAYAALTAATSIGYFLCIALRVWLTYFDVGLAIANSDAEWVSLIAQPPLRVYSARRMTDRLLLRTISLSTSSRRSTMVSVIRESSRTHADAMNAAIDAEKAAEAAMNWFFRHKHTWGSMPFVGSRMIAAYFFFVFLVVVISSVPTYDGLLDSLYAFVGGSIMIFCGVIAFKFPSRSMFNDALFVREEMFFMLLLALVFMLISVVLSGLAMGPYDGRTASDAEIFWFELCRNISLVIFAVGLALLQTQGVRERFGESLARAAAANGGAHAKKTSNVATALSFMTSIVSRTSIGDSVTSTKSVTEDVTLMDVFASGEMFRAFMKHLFKEFCYENALCLYEMLEFRRMLWNKEHGVEESGSIVSKMKSISAASPSPSDTSSDEAFGAIRFAISSEVKSAIVTYPGLTDVQKYMCLFDKYVDVTAQMSVNLSHHCRKDAAFKCEKFARETTFQVRDGKEDEGPIAVAHDSFDWCIRELLRLMNDSLERFKRSEDVRLPTVEV
jgi:hypothetical protein